MFLSIIILNFHVYEMQGLDFSSAITIFGRVDEKNIHFMLHLKCAKVDPTIITCKFFCMSQNICSAGSIFSKYFDSFHPI